MRYQIEFEILRVAELNDALYLAKAKKYIKHTQNEHLTQSYLS